MNSLALKKSINLALKKFYFLRIANFGAKKTTKPTSGSDVEADKSKKVLRGGNNSDSENVAPQQSQKEEAPKRDFTTNIHVVETVEGHKAPSSEDTVSGRYGQTLFIAASRNNDLHNVYLDMGFFLNSFDSSAEFRLFINNAGLNLNQINSVIDDLAECGGFCNTTKTFLQLLASNKRFMYLDQVAQNYIRNYKLLSREEKITIVSAYELDSTQKDSVKNALMSNPENKGKNFIIDYSVNPSIIGGLQMYSESKFMDLSLSSRIDKLKDEVNKMI